MSTILLNQMSAMGKENNVCTDAILRVYNNPICEIIDDYNCSAYYDPSPYIARSYYAGGF